jgi:hypothetical protein
VARCCAGSRRTDRGQGRWRRNEEGEPQTEDRLSPGDPRVDEQPVTLLPRGTGDVRRARKNARGDIVQAHAQLPSERDRRNDQRGRPNTTGQTPVRRPLRNAVLPDDGSLRWHYPGRFGGSRRKSPPLSRPLAGRRRKADPPTATPTALRPLAGCPTSRRARVFATGGGWRRGQAAGPLGTPSGGRGG